MARFSLPLTRLIHEELSVVMSFAFSQRPLTELVDTKFHGEWKYLRKALFEVSVQHANRACIELALFLRLLDDQEHFSQYANRTDDGGFGSLVGTDGESKALMFRDVANKIIHASDLEWDLSDENNPLLVCHAPEEQQPKFKWIRANIDVVAVASVCGRLMS